MSFTIPSVSEFKAQFPRDFPYAVLAWGAAIRLTIVAGVVTAADILSGGQGYASAPTLTLLDEVGAGFTAIVTVAVGKVTNVTITTGGTGYSTATVPVFTGGAGDDTDLKKVRDTDILGAQQDAHFNVGQGLFDYQTNWARAYNYATAHCLVQKLIAGGEGIYSQFNWLTAGKGVDGVSQQFAIPDKIMADPFLSMYSTTKYGMMYLQIIAPLLIGNMITTHRETLP